MSVPNEAPPPYEAATSARPPPAASSATLHPTRNGIPPMSRRSMEDESRELPSGWVRQYDDREHHQFFVDTRAEPPRSIWHHPYDDDEYMRSLSAAERARIAGLHRVPSEADIIAGDTDEEDAHTAHHANPNFGAAAGQLPPRPEEQPKGMSKLGRKMKDKLTNSSHEEREQKRRQREEEERRYYEQHQQLRAAMSRAIQTGQPQLLGKDKSGRDVYIEAPGNPFGNRYGGNGYGYSPYGSGMYNTPNARYLRPQVPYRRPCGYGYGGGMGMPLAAGLGGGLLFGGMMSSAMF